MGLGTRIPHPEMPLYLQVLVSLGQASNGGTNPAALRQSVPQDTVTGLFRDMRGIAIATNSRRTYGEANLCLFMLTCTMLTCTVQQQQQPWWRWSAAGCPWPCSKRWCCMLACTTSRRHRLCAGLLFDWLHPAHFATIVAALEAWADIPEVIHGPCIFCSPLKADHCPGLGK